VAELIDFKKSVVRDFAANPNKWKKASKGDLFKLGDALKTGKNATALLRLNPEGQMRVENDTIVRFQTTPDSEQGHRLEIETGSVQIESGDGDLQIQTLVGLARIERGSRLQIQSGEQEYNLNVLVGSVQIDKEGKTISLPSGENISLDIGGVVIDQEPEDDTNTQPQEIEAEGEAIEEPVSEDTEDKSMDQPTFADLTVSTGETFTVHDPNPPTNIRIPIQKCQEGGVVEVGRLRGGYRHAAAKGESNAIVRLEAGRYRYRIRCLDKGKPQKRAVASGRIKILRDAAIRQLPRRAPSIIVEADGRTYTVRFQNQLPKLTLRWPEPPPSKSYTIDIKAADGGKHSERGKKPSFSFKSGEFREGSFTFQFTTPEGRRSPLGKMRIAFDNLARTAYLSDPVEGKTTSGEKVRVAGAVLAKSTVKVAGTPVSIDNQGRFQKEVTAPTDGSAIAVRVGHRATGIHYYLRHLKDNQ